MFRDSRTATVRGIASTRPFWLASLLLLLLLLAVAGCRRSPADGSSNGDQPSAVRTHTERGPVRIEVEVTPAPARLSDEPRLTLTIDAEQGIDVEPPPFGEAVGDFLILDYQNPLPQSRDDRQILRQTYTLEPTRTGSLQVAPISVYFTDNRPGGDGERHMLQSELLVVEVKSMVDSEAPTLADLQGLDQPVELPGSRRWWIWLAAAGSGLLLLVVVVVLSRRRSTKVQQAPPELPPHELARRELDQLLRQGLQQTDVKAFYTELTSIVRRFIERTTAVRAPEQTTEEFLREIERSDLFSGGERQRLKWFLESADLVKFAAHQPRAEDIEQAIERARAFIGLSVEEVVA